jgi:dipeptidyl aminopeptidase/acylaminoacyl peptidase
VSLAAWYVPARPPARGRAVVLAHGYSSCRRDPVLLLPMGMLNRNGFATLLVDLRDHGDSTVVDGRWAGGADEYADVLGAWDWMVAGRGFAPAAVGLFGASMGAGAALIAIGEEARIPAAWVDCGFADIDVAIREELRFRDLPAWIVPPGMLAARLVDGIDLRARTPLRGVSRLCGRPLGIAHGEGDTHAPVHHAFDLAAAARTAGSEVDIWTIPGAEHNQGMFMVPDEYERRLVSFFARALAPPGTAA